MKFKILSVITLLGVSVLVSCNNDLNVVQPSQFTSSSMWTEESDATSAVNGLYTQFRNSFSFLLSDYGELRTNLYKSGNVNDAFYNRVGTNKIVPNDEGTDWRGIYTTINSANLILKYAPNISFLKESTRNEVLANAYFIRAYCYFTLARVFGDCPLLTVGYESAIQDDMYPMRTPVAKVFELVAEDIKQAESLIPASSKELHKASPTAINMLKADFYLWKAKRLNGDKNDLQTAQSAINSVLNSGYSLLPNFADIFDVGKERNTEFIWTLPYTINENVGAGTSCDTYSLYLAAMSDRTKLGNLANTLVPIGSHAHYITATLDYCKFLTSDSRDTRAGVSVRVYDNKQVTDLEYYTMIIKFQGSWKDNTRYFDNDVPMYRLAEAYLMKAEVENALGNPIEAIKNLNVIAKRAYGVDNYYVATNKDSIDNYIIDEYMKEFVSEAKVWWVFMRFNKEFERVGPLKALQGQKNITLWPVSFSCMTTNSKITQTEGY